MIKNLLFISILVIAGKVANSQNFNGQWKGGFVDNSSVLSSWADNECDYTLELEVRGNEVSGFSYTYFNAQGKKYFTICKLKGFVNRAIKYIEVKEVERTKTNVPPNITNCFQVHKLNYSSSAEGEVLSGNWIPAPNQSGNCGYGTTRLMKRQLKSIVPNFNAKNIGSPSVPIAKTLSPERKTLNAPSTSPKIAKVEKPEKKERIVIEKKSSSVARNPVIKIEPDKKIDDKDELIYEDRAPNVLRTILVDKSVIKVELYDNGQIDGDSISVFYNGKLLLSKQRLTEKPITLTLPVNDGQNDFVMYAENLGSIPPNTALMIIRDGERKYEVGISSDLDKSGTIRFVRREKN